MRRTYRCDIRPEAEHGEGEARWRNPRHREAWPAERVLDAAVALFAEHGVHGTSLQMIADRVGVSKAAVYYQFHSKEDIALEVIRPSIEDIARFIRIADGASRRAAAARRGRQRAGRNGGAAPTAWR